MKAYISFGGFAEDLNDTQRCLHFSSGYGVTVERGYTEVVKM